MKIKNFQNCGQDNDQDGGSKLELPITELFMNQFGSNLIPRHIKKFQKIKIKTFQNGGQDGGPKLKLPITESFINRYCSNLNRRHK